MKTFIKSIFKFIKQSIYFLLFLLKVIYNKGYKSPIKKAYLGTVAVLANGPSLKNVISRLETEAEFKNIDFIVLNYFAFEGIFFKIKPKHYCLADPMFFGDSHRKSDVLRLFLILQKQVNWNINLYIPKSKLKDFKRLSKLTNPYIKIVPLNVIEYTGYECLRFKFYEKGISMPLIYTVANMAIYTAINLGYSQIKLYGVEHTFLESLTVNDKNQLCNKDKHFYDKEEVQLKPIIKNDTLNEIWKIGDYLIGIAGMFKSHDLLARYAKYKNVQIINCTKGSMIDSYEREESLLNHQE